MKVVGSPQPVPTQVILNQRDFIHRLLSGKFGEIADFFKEEGENYNKFRISIGDFCDSQLHAIGNKWIELAFQPILH